jgi:hypothetical protein
MLKTIPKSSITTRKFQVYKLWNVSESEYPTTSISGSDSLYRSIKSKYYNQTDGNVFNIFGSTRNPANIVSERNLPESIRVIDIDRSRFGERIKPKSIVLQTSDGDEYVDDGFGKIINPTPTYVLKSLDVENETLIIQIEGDDVEITIQSLDLMSGFCLLIYEGDSAEFFVTYIDFQEGIVKFLYELEFNGTSLEVTSFGNVFYSDGVLVLNAILGLNTYTLEYRSTQTIYETEVLISAKAGEFNYSQNPSAVKVQLSGSYDFETTAITNTSPSKNVKIKEVRDIVRREWYSGSINSSISGSWEDYYNSSSIDPTGSYLTTYITTIGLYDDNGDMVAIAKLPKPIKNLPDYDINFLIRFDT